MGINRDISKESSDALIMAFSVLRKIRPEVRHKPETFQFNDDAEDLLKRIQQCLEKWPGGSRFPLQIEIDHSETGLDLDYIGSVFSEAKNQANLALVSLPDHPEFQNIRSDIEKIIEGDIGEGIDGLEMLIGDITGKKLKKLH